MQLEAKEGFLVKVAAELCLPAPYAVPVSPPTVPWETEGPNALE